MFFKDVPNKISLSKLSLDQVIKQFKPSIFRYAHLDFSMPIFAKNANKDVQNTSKLYVTLVIYINSKVAGKRLLLNFCFQPFFITYQM